jgi:hypothetical protein
MAGILIPFLIFTPWLTAILVWFISDKHEEDCINLQVPEQSFPQF